ncbi:MAG: hypothetical protein KA205_06590 [Acidobacteria bacterium]|nr:hypothetical protein [Acidobacteriota bacterium]
MFVLQLVCIVTLAEPAAVRAFLYRQLYPLIPVDRSQLHAPPAALRALGYRLDDPAELHAFKSVATPHVEAARTDGERLRALGDLLYRLRRPEKPWVSGGREMGVHTMLQRMQDGESGLCGHMTIVLAALWRSLGREFREVRFTVGDERAWYAAHYGIEVFDPDRSRWMYYDVGLNGYAVDDTGQPLSLDELNRLLADGADVAIVASTQHQDWNASTFLTFLREHSLQVVSVNNELRGLDADRRFGPLNFAYGLLSRLPRPLDRVIDALTGDSAPRLVLADRTPPPADTARLHVIASLNAAGPSR